MKANWRFLTFITYPHILFWFEAACLAVDRSPHAQRTGCSRRPLAIRHPCVGRPVLRPALDRFEIHGKRTYLLYLMCDTIWTWEFSHRERPEWDQRLDRFAQHVCDVARSSEAEEIVLVGHSSGSFLGTEILARALKLDPSLGKQARASCC